MSIKRTIITTIVSLALVAMVAPGVAQGVTIEELQAQINALLAQLSALQGGSTTTTTGNVPSACVGVTFTRSLTVGSTGSDVKCLQVLMNNNGYQIASTGAGSPGNETSYFGGLTLAAVKSFQAAKGWTPANQVGPMTRAALNAMITGGTGGGNTTNPTGPVSATLSFDTPAAGALIGSQSQADMLHINFTGNGTITSVTLQRSGVSDQNLFTNVYLYDGATRLTDGYAFNTAGTLTMNGLSIPVSGSKVVSVRGDVMASASSTQGSAAITLTGYTANGTATSANVTGNMMSVVSGTLATAYMTTNTATLTANVNAGTSQYTMWSDTVQVNTRTIQLKAMNFKMIGSAPSNALANVRLFVDGVDTGTIATIGSIQGSNYAMFVFATPINLTTGSHTIDVRADVVTGANRSMQLSVQQAADMTLYDPTVGVNIAVAADASTAFTSDAGTTVSILTGSSTVVIDPTFSSQTNITAGATNAVIGKFIVHGYGEDVKVSTLYVLPSITSATSTGSTCTTDATTGATDSGKTCGISNVTLYFNGTQVGTQQNMSSANMGVAGTGTRMTFTLGSQMIIPAGQDSTLEVRADLQTTAGVNYTGGTVKTLVDYHADNNNAQGQNSSETIDFPSADVTTAGLSISSASLVVSKNTAYANASLTPNTPNARIGSYTVQNQSSSESVRITSLNVKMYDSSDNTLLDSDSSPTLTNFSGLKTSVTSGAGSTPIVPTANDTFSVNETLAPGEQKVIDIYANTGTEGSSVQLYTKLTVASIGVTSNIVDTGTIQTGQTITLGTGTVQTPTLVASASTPDSIYVSAGTTGATDGSVATFKFISTGGSATITELKFSVTGTDANPSQTVSQICVTGGKCGSPAVSSGTQQVYLTGLNLAVPNGGSGLNQEVKISYSPVGTGGVVPNKTSTVTLTYVKYTSGGSTGESSPSVAAPTVYLVGSQPLVTVNTNSVTGLNFGGVENKIGEVTVKADSKGGIKLNDLKFTVTSTGFNTYPTFTSARIADGSTTISGSSCGQGTAASASQTIFCEFATSGNTMTTGLQTTNTESNADFDGYEIAAGQQKTFSLYATVSAVDSSNVPSSVSTSLNAAGFNWDDTSYAVFAADGSSASPSDGTGLTGSSIYNFPTGSYTIKE